MCLSVTLTWLESPLTQPVRTPIPDPNSKYDKSHNSALHKHLAQPQAAIDAAREQAILGHVPAHLIPALASPNTDIINRKSPGRFGSPCRPRRKAIRKITASRTLHSTLPAILVQRRFATPFNLPPPQLHQTMSHPMLASSASLTQLTVTRTPYKTLLLRPPRLTFDGYEGELLMSSRLFLDATTRPYCPEALFLFFSRKLSLPLCVKTTHERCGPFSLVVLSQRRGSVTTPSGPTLSETLSSTTLQVSYRLNSVKTTRL